MTSIARSPLEIASPDPWRAVAETVHAWARREALALRDAVLLVPFAQHLPLARRAFAQQGGWQPRIETTMTLARSLAPPAEIDASQLRFDPALDRLGARRLLRSQSFGQALQRHDARGFDHAVGSLVKTAHALARAAAAVPPARRQSHWATARELLGAAAGPGGTERLLARIALEWAAASAEPATDLLFSLRPSAWIVVQAGGPQPMASALLAEATVPRLLIDADPPLSDPLQPVGSPIAVATCADFEAEAMRCAAEVLSRLAQGDAPVALVAQDRLLMRRVRALLSRAQVPIADETGWKLSTTRAGATIAALLRVALPRADADDWLDWLKSCGGPWPGLPDVRPGVRALESAMRREGWVTPAAVDAARLPPAAAAVWTAAQGVVDALRQARTRSFSAWLASLREALAGCGGWETLSADDAGRQALTALHLDDLSALPADGDATMTLHEFNAWLDDTLEDATFIPEAPAAPQVVITPLAQTVLRPFAAVLLPGADEKRLGAHPAPHPLLSDTQAEALGLPNATRLREAELLAFAQLLRQPSLTLLRRLDDGGEPLAPSPLLERLGQALRAAGTRFTQAPDPLVAVDVVPQPVSRPAPVAPDLLPSALSASACEALRACPYKFHALRMLKLGETEELDDEVDKRAYGKWLHEVLHRFHLEREAPADAAIEEARLREVAIAVRDRLALDEASFLPFWATFSRLVPHYVRWLHGRDAAGARWVAGEQEMTAQPPSWAGVTMKGIIDRIDRIAGADGPVTELIDYKTGSADTLKKKLARPQEDTQLAFYAALLLQQPGDPGPLSASYLPLDESDGVAAMPHKEVEATAVRLVAGLGRDLARVRAGAPLPALGEGDACTFCDARGLCRRDHWIADPEPTP
jgi:ATP-dependent helicase/nuclease subunit B